MYSTVHTLLTKQFTWHLLPDFSPLLIASQRHPPVWTSWYWEDPHCQSSSQ